MTPTNRQSAAPRGFSTSESICIGLLLGGVLGICGGLVFAWIMLR